MGGDAPLGPVCLWRVSLAKLRLWVQPLVPASAGCSALPGWSRRVSAAVPQDAQGHTRMHRDT